MEVECVDRTARLDIKELQTIIYGPDKNDGLCERVESIEKTCSECRRGSNVEVAKTGAKGQVDVAKLTLVGVAIMQVTQILITLFKK